MNHVFSGVVCNKFFSRPSFEWRKSLRRFAQKYLGRLPAGLLRLCGSLTPMCSSLPSTGPKRKYRTRYNNGNVSAVGQQFPLMANRFAFRKYNRLDEMIKADRAPIKHTGTFTTAFDMKIASHLVKIKKKYVWTALCIIKHIFCVLYLNDVNFLSAIVPDFKLLDVSLYIFRDSHRAHLGEGAQLISSST